jgi:polyadenylation factor subunit 2
VTASDDSTLKIFDFATSTEESTLTGHNWDAKSVDWHPTKGLLVSGSKDHQVKLWDPRTGRCLTTLHGHKNTISRVSFEPHRGQLLATCARDSTGRIFDLRMMRDICLLKGHDKEIATLTWHPIHPSLLSTGGVDGSIYHFLLDEPNTPPGISTSIPPYDSPDPANTPAQTIYPAHRIQYAHDFPVWSLHWHPLGHILASGSNDKFTRFWTRARPGETECFNDRYHLGEAGAEAYGTWDRRNNMKAMKEREEQELEDEAEGLVDQQMPTQQPILPGLPGLTMNNPGVAKDGTSVGGAQSLQPVPPPPISFLRGGERPLPPPNGIASMDPAQFAAMMAEGRLMVPPPPMPGANGLPPPLPPNFDFSKMPPPGMFPPGFPPGSNFPVPPLGFVPPPLPGMGANGFASLPGMQPPLPGMAPPPGMGGLGNGPVGIMGAENGGGVRRRAPLPSQEESLMREQQHGKYRLAR